MVVILVSTACKKEPSYCNNEIIIEEIKLSPLKPWWGGHETIVKNDSLIKFISKQICEIDRNKTFYRTGTKGLINTVHIQFKPNILKRSEQLYVSFYGAGENYYVLHEGDNTYFRNDILCEMIAKLTETYIESEDKK